MAEATCIASIGARLHFEHLSRGRKFYQSMGEGEETIV